MQIAWQGQIGKAPQPEKLRRRGTEQGGVRCGGYFRHLLEHAEVHRRQAVFVDMEQATVGLSAERAVLLLIDPLEQQALVELHGPFQIRTQFLEGGVEQPQLESPSPPRWSAIPETPMRISASGKSLMRVWRRALPNMKTIRSRCPQAGVCWGC